MRKILSLFILTFILRGCNNQKKEKTMETSKNEKLVKEYFEHFNNHQ